jgi:hypothetical protein
MFDTRHTEGGDVGWQLQSICHAQQRDAQQNGCQNGSVFPVFNDQDPC